jgi:hypothetical protein
MTIKHYAAKYIKLSRYAVSLIPDEKRKVQRFQGLHPQIK